MIGTVLAGGAGLLILALTWAAARLRSEMRERERLARQLSDLEKHLETIEENTVQPIVRFETRGIIRTVNRAAEKLTGYASSELLSNNILKLVPDARFTTQQSETIEIRRKDRSRARLRYNSVRSEASGTPCIYLFFESGEPAPVAREAPPEEPAREAVAAAPPPPLPYAAKIVGRIAGQYESLLTAINGYGEFALGQIAESSPLRDELEEIVSASGRASNLTRHLVAFSGAQLVPVSPIDLHGLVEGMREELGRELPCPIDFDLQAIERLPLGNEEWLRQVILLLCHSACGRMKNTDRLSIRTWQKNVPAPLLLQSGELSAGSYGVLAIADSGRPLNRQTLEHLFEPLYPVDEDLGIEISPIYGILQSLGGGINVVSGDAAGTSFEILLPCANLAQTAGS